MPILLVTGYYLPDPSPDFFLGIVILVFMAAGCIFVSRFFKHIFMTLVGATDDQLIKYADEKIDGGEHKRKELFELIRDGAPKEQIKAKEEEIRQMFKDRANRWNLVLGTQMGPMVGSMAAVGLAFFAAWKLDITQIIGLDRLWIALGFILIYIALKKVNSDFDARDQKVREAGKKVKADV